MQLLPMFVYPSADSGGSSCYLSLRLCHAALHYNGTAAVIQETELKQPIMETPVCLKEPGHPIMGAGQRLDTAVVTVRSREGESPHRMAFKNFLF